MRLKALTAALLCSVLPISSALADDTYNWSGLYAGAHAGYAWGDATTRDDPADWGTDPKYIGPFNFDINGAFGGGQLGYNHQFGNVVLGVEADFGYMDLTGSRRTDSSNPVKYQTLELDGGLYALAAVRAGYTIDRTLIYAKGGYVWLDGDVTQTTTNPGYQTNGSGALTGWAYGGGIEHALGDRWSVKAEYLHFDFDTADGDQTSISDPPIGHVYENETASKADTFKIGFNIKLN